MYNIYLCKIFYNRNFFGYFIEFKNKTEQIKPSCNVKSAPRDFGCFIESHHKVGMKSRQHPRCSPRGRAANAARLTQHFRDVYDLTSTHSL